MKTSIRFYLFPIIMMFSSACSKKEDVKTTKIQIVEYKTEQPIKFTSVVYIDPTIVCGGLICNQDVFSGNTDGGGFCEVPANITNNEQNVIQVVYANGYWEFSSRIHSSDTKYELDKYGQEKLHLLKTNTFPKGYYMNIYIQGERSSSNYNASRIYAFPADSTIVIPGYGGQKNSITWKVYDSTDAIISTGGPLLTDVSGTDTNTVDLKY